MDELARQRLPSGLRLDRFSDAQCATSGRVLPSSASAAVR
jgi:hypothetical protein